MRIGSSSRKKPARRFWRTVSVRLFILALAVLLPFQAAGAGLVMQGQAAIRQEIKQSNVSAIRALCEMLVRETANLQYQIDALSTNDQLIRFMLNPEALPASEFYSELLEHHRLLRRVLLGNPFIDDIVIYYRGFDKKNAATIGYIQASAAESAAARAALAPAPGPFRRLDGELAMGAFYPQNTLLAASEPAYTVLMTISPGAIRNLLTAAGADKTIVLYSHALEESLITGGAALDSDTLSPILAYVTDAGRADLEFTRRGMYVLSVYSPELDCSLTQIMPEESIFQTPYNYTLMILIFTLVSVIALGIYTIISHRLIKRPVTQILKAFSELEAGKLSVAVPPVQATREFAELAAGFNQMSSRLARAVDELYAKELYAHKMELKQLQAQINPHFLYNTYFLLHRLIAQEDFDTALRLSGYLGEYFQYITRNFHDKATLRMEWGHAANYLEIQAIRFSGGLNVEQHAPPEDAMDFLVPRLILQPIVENAVEYGIKESPDGAAVKLLFSRDDRSIHFCVENTGRHLSDDEFASIRDRLRADTEIDAETTALTNIHRRLRLEYGGESGLQIKRNPEGGLIVYLWIERGEDGGDDGGRRGPSATNFFEKKLDKKL